MKRVTAIATAVFLMLLLVAITVSNVKAQDLNTSKTTFMTFSGPVELPGMTLPAGTYTFRLGDNKNPNVVQVLSEDQKQNHGIFLIVPAERRDPSSETVVTFKETSETATPAVQFWFYPGETIGKEFVYPKDQAMRIAARTHSTVLSVDGEIGPEAKVSSIDQSGKMTAWQREADAAPLGAGQAEAQPNQDAAVPAQPTAAAGSLAGNRGIQGQSAETTIRSDVSSDSNISANTTVGTSGQAAADTRMTNQVAANELPRTASPLPLSGLIGLLSLAGGLGLRAYRR